MRIFQVFPSALRKSIDILHAKTAEPRRQQSTVGDEGPQLTQEEITLFTIKDPAKRRADKEPDNHHRDYHQPQEPRLEKQAKGPSGCQN